MKPDPFILECDKTGRWWPCPSRKAAERAARDYGLTNYTIFKA